MDCFALKLSFQIFKMKKLKQMISKISRSYSTLNEKISYFYSCCSKTPWNTFLLPSCLFFKVQMKSYPHSPAPVHDGPLNCPATWLALLYCQTCFMWFIHPCCQCNYSEQSLSMVPGIIYLFFIIRALDVVDSSYILLVKAIETNCIESQFELMKW